MEETSVNQDGDISTMSMLSYTARTNWEIAYGSLSDSIIFDSSAAPTADADADAVLSYSKSSLLLRPDSLHSPPCEITITFAQQHQVRQVYVRSTARVYEIYYAPNSQTYNEYLCTVRCGVAIRDDQVLQSNCTLEDLKVADEVLDEKNGKRSCSSSTNEDGWVHVKTPLRDDGNYFSAGSGNSSGNMLDFYEATAEIAHANPCMSVTVRLLSLQEKGCVFVDEIYVYGDLVDLNTSENKADQVGNTSASSMYMLFPALLQLSKSRGLSQMQNEQALDTEKEKTVGTLPKMIEQERSPGKNEKEETSCSGQQSEIGLPGAGCLELNQNDFRSEVSDELSKRATSCDRTESLLDQLVSKVAKLEDLLRRFEYNMLEPIRSIDSRLQHVEQQVEELSRKSKNQDMKTCERYSAPEFSCSSSDHCPLFNIKNGCPNSDLSASTEKDYFSPLANESVHMADSTESFSSLMVKVSEFQNVNDGEDDLSAADPSVGEPKLLIDDALASALAGFMSSTLTEPHRYTQALVVKAPDFPSEDDGGAIAQIASMQSESRISSHLLDSNDETDSVNHVKDLVLSSSSFSTAPVEVQYSSNDIVDHSSGTAEKPATGAVKNNRVLPVRVDDDIATTDFPQLTDSSQLSVVLDEADIMNQFLKSQTLDISDVTHEAEAAVKKSEPKQNVCGKVSSENIIQNVLGLSCSSSRIDFRTSILDVKFDSPDEPQPESTIEFLLGEMPISDYNQYDGGLLDDGGGVDQGDCILVTAEEGEIGRKLSDHLDYYSLNSAASRLKGGKQDKFEDEAFGRVKWESSSLI